jgi:hypothetical protein
MNRLAKFWALPAAEKKLLCEAVFLLSGSTASVKTIAFTHIERFLRACWSGGSGHIKSANGEQEIRLVQRSISRATKALPWTSSCLSQSIAEFIMLRRRGIQAVILAGARFSDHSSLDAHAWVETDLPSDKSPENSTYATLIRIG